MISFKRTLLILTISLTSAASAETYDVVVVGGSTMGVAAAAEAADRGAKVLLVEANSYLGVDLAGKLALRTKTLRRDHSRPDCLETQLARAMNDPVGEPKVVTPLRIKQICDRQLLDRHIPFRTWTYPCGILKDRDGNVAGIVVASRNGFETIAAKTLVDATEFGRLAEKAGSTFSAFASGRTAFRRGLVTDQPKKYEWRPFACEMTDFSARGLAAAEQAARDATWTPATLDAADTLLLEENRRLVKDARYVWTVGLYSAQTDHMKAIAAGREAGRAAAEAARKRPALGTTERDMGVSETVTCDVLVAGAGTGGAPAAIAAARSGLKTIVCDPLYRMGGVMTDGLIDSYCYGLRIGFTTEIDKGVAALKASVRGVGKAEWFRRAVREAGGEAWFGALVVGLEKSGNKVTSATVVFADGSLCRVQAKCTIDATGNADLAALAGEETEFIDGTELSLQGAGSTAKVLGRTYLNTDCGFVDDTDAEDLMNFTLRARLSMGAYAWDQSQIVNSRERRRLHGVAYVTPQDVIMNRTYPDVIARTHSNFDTHGQTVGAQFFIEAPHAAQPITVNLPYGCILPKKTDGLLVIGLGMSAHRDAMPILRMQPDVQNQGFAAGTAAALAVKGGIAPRAIDVKALQRKMIDAGILDKSVLTMKDSFPLPDATLAQAAKTLDDGYKGLAELLTDPVRAIPLLKSGKGLPSAHVLTMLGDGTRAQQVADAVAASAWDAGWNYRGMDQFGRSVSWMDSYLIALGRAKASCALEPLVKKASELSIRDAYSHFRAVALCAEGLNDRAAVPALSRLLALPGVGGHAQRPIIEAGVVPIPEYAYWESGNRGIADRERSDCLRELCLARALFNLGDDAAKSGERTLRAYAADPRKAYANHAKKVLSRPALVLRFDDNKPPAQWREIAEIFEAANGRCSFAVNAANLDADQWRTLRELSERGHEIMDHTGQHAVFKLLLDSAADAESYRSADFFDHVERRLVLCRPEADLAHPKNVRVTAAMTAGLLRSDDPKFISAQFFSRKFYVPSTKTFYGLGKDCGAGLFKKGPEQKCSDFWGRWTTNSFASCEIILLANDAVQPSMDLLRAQARNTVSRFLAHGLPSPRTWIRPGGWETNVDWRRMKAVYGDEFGYAVADSTCGEGLTAYSPWCYRSDFAFFDQVPDVEKVYQKAAKALANGHSFAYISHQWTKDRANYLMLCRGLAAMLKANGIRLTTYAHIAD